MSLKLIIEPIAIVDNPINIGFSENNQFKFIFYNTSPISVV